MSRRRRLAVAAGLGAVAVGFYALAQTVVSGSAPHSAPRVAKRAPVTGHLRTGRPGPVRIAGSTGDLPERSQAGAVRSAATYLELVDQAPSVLGAVSRLRDMTQPPFTEQVVRAEAVTLALTNALDAGGSGLVRGWRLGWRVTSYTPATAKVAIWSMGIVESPVEIIAPDWSTTVCVLQWSVGGWRVAAAHSTPGPTPPLVGASQAAVAGFVRSAAGFHAFADAP